MAEPDVRDRARRRKALLGSALFFALAPGVVAGVVPALITGWEVDHRLPAALRGFGVGSGGLAVAFLLHAFGRFAIEGMGTPAPAAPTERLVVGGVYRYLRNPMYVAVLTAIAGQGLFFGSVALAYYAALMAIAFVLFVRIYEEPTLRAQFGVEYERYRAAVPGWFPRRTPWRDAP